MSDLDRLLELRTLFTEIGFYGTKEDQDEYESLKAKIESQLEDGEKFRTSITTTTYSKGMKFCPKCDEKIIISYPHETIWIDNNRVEELQSQITTLTNALEKSDEWIDKYKQKIKELTNEKKQLEEELERVSDKLGNELQVEVLKNKQYKTLVSEIKERIKNLGEQIEVAEREDYADIDDYGLRYKKDELEQILQKYKEKK